MMNIKELRKFDTVVEAQNALREEGYSYEFDTQDGKLFAIGKEETPYQPADLQIIGDLRYEGMSNPADNMILYIIEAKDGTKGTMLDNVGGSESAQDPEIIKQIPIKEEK